MNRQRGVTFVGMLFIAALIIVAAIIGLKLVPAYIEFATVTNILRDVARSPEARSGNVKDIQTSFRKHAQIDGIETVKAEDLEVDKDGDQVVIRANYSTKIKLVGNLSACIDFAASSGN
ncbi:MAG TPA: DUF4845 domain-containing protein [Burkholderiales bacterium]|nr:DUF4845 domain-containing protein [Burkholderiales bacterium]